MAEWSPINFSTLAESDFRFDAEYYQARNLELAAKLSVLKPVPVNSFAYVTDGIHASPDFVDKGGVTYLSAKCVKENYYVLTDAGQISKEQDQANPRTRAQVGDVLLTTVGTIGNAAVVYEDILPANMDRHLGIIRITDKEKVNPYYLATFLNCEFGRFQTIRESTGNVQLNLFIEKIKKLLIPLGNKFSGAGKLTRKAYEILRNAEPLYGEAETEMLDRMGWEELKNIPSELFYTQGFSETIGSERGDAEYFQPKHKRRRRHLLKVGAESIGNLSLSYAKGTQPEVYTEDGEIYVVKSKNVYSQGIEIENCERTTLAALGDIPARLNAGDLIINSTGRGTLGRAAVVPETNKKIIASVDLTIWRLNKADVLPEYASLFLNSPPGLEQTEQFQTGSSGQLHLYPQHIKKFLIYLPRNLSGEIDIQWQEKLVKKVIVAQRAKCDAQAKLDEAKQIVEDIIRSSNS